MPETVPKPLEVVPIVPPPEAQRVCRQARFAAADEKRTRYHLPERLESPSPVGYRTRVPLTREEAEQVLPLLALTRPDAFVPGEPPTERELFEEVSLGVLTARQSTNFRGHREVVLDAADSAALVPLLRELGLDPLEGATHTHLVFTRPYRTPFTLLLTFVGHPPVASLFTVPLRAWRKWRLHADDIPTIGYLQQLHLGVLADGMERAAPIASEGRRRANVLRIPPHPQADVLRRIEALAELTAADRRAGWRLALVAQVGEVEDRMALPRALWRKLGANLLAFRSERIQPGVNQEDKAPPPFQARQDTDVPEALTVMAGRAAYNAFAHWTGCDRERSKELLLLDRIDVLTPDGKERLRSVRRMLEEVTDAVIRGLPWWVDLPTGRALSRNAERGRKAFALAGQRIYIAGLSRPEVEAEGLDWDHAVFGVGAAAARSALYAELMGVVELPEGADLLAGICVMAGPVNQNDIGKQFHGHSDLLAPTYGDREPTSLLVWTLKAKTVADPIGNEQQLLDARRKGALVDLRPGPHEVVWCRREGALVPMRREGDRVNAERAFADVGNFVTDPEGAEIPGNRGEAWEG